jgi:hypothetical protein
MNRTAGPQYPPQLRRLCRTFGSLPMTDTRSTVGEPGRVLPAGDLAGGLAAGLPRVTAAMGATGLWAGHLSRSVADVPAVLLNRLAGELRAAGDAASVIGVGLAALTLAVLLIVSATALVNALVDFAGACGRAWRSVARTSRRTPPPAEAEPGAPAVASAPAVPAQQEPSARPRRPRSRRGRRHSGSRPGPGEITGRQTAPADPPSGRGATAAPTVQRPRSRRPR